jgi:murein DD-endopeptidase MepM/ murein hydrolase activator NlpD
MEIGMARLLSLGAAATTAFTLLACGGGGSNPGPTNPGDPPVAGTGAGPTAPGPVNPPVAGGSSESGPPGPVGPPVAGGGSDPGTSGPVNPPVAGGGSDPGASGTIAPPVAGGGPAPGGSGPANPPAGSADPCATPTAPAVPSATPANVIPAPAGTTCTLVDASGRTQALASVATVTWPVNAFDQPAVAKVSATTTADTDDDFRQTAALFAPADLRSYEIRINTGGTAPRAPVHVDVTIPAALAAGVSPSQDVQAFAQILEEGADDSIDAFELLPSTKDAAAGTLSVDVPAEAFTASRTADDSVEAVLVLGLTPGVHHDAIAAARSHARSAPAASDVCAARFVGSPFTDFQPGKLVVTDRYAPPGHKGVDYRAADGASLAAVEDGVITTSGYQVSKTKKNRFGQPSGWGNYVILRLGDGNMILYAHMKEGTRLPAGTAVSRGDKVGEADSSGGVTGPHLHLEYARPGTAYNAADKIDPDPCIRPALMVGSTYQNPDWENQVSVKIDGISYGISPVEASWVGAGMADGLAPGVHTLTIEPVHSLYATEFSSWVPPDQNVATADFVIWLGHGWKFIYEPTPDERIGGAQFLDWDSPMDAAGIPPMLPYSANVWDSLFLHESYDYHFIVPAPATQ